MSVILASNFDPKSVVFSQLEKTKKGGKIVYLGLGADGKQRIAIQTPAMALPFGVTPYSEANGEIQSYSLDVSFRTEDVDPKVADFRRILEELDDVLVDAGTENSEAWFGKKMSRDLVSEFHRKLVNNKNPNYPPTLRVKVAVGLGGEPAAQFYDENRNPVGIEYLVKGCAVKMICEISSVWFVNKTFGCTLRLVQAAVVSRPRRIEGYAFQDDAENEEPVEM